MYIFLTEDQNCGQKPQDHQAGFFHSQGNRKNYKQIHQNCGKDGQSQYQDYPAGGKTAQRMAHAARTAARAAATAVWVAVKATIAAVKAIIAATKALIAAIAAGDGLPCW